MDTRAKALLPIDELRKMFSYDPETGVVTRLVGRTIATKHGAKNSNGYLRFGIGSMHITAHRIAWALAKGEWPTLDLDHINGVRTDNRLVNLRLATPRENQCNRGATRLNTSGRKGVTFNRKSKKWQASIKVDGRSIYLGLFKSLSAAGDAYELAAMKYAGRFAPETKE